MNVLPKQLSPTSSWKLERDRNGIKVFTRNVEGYQVKEFKGQVELNIPAKVAYEYIQNIETWNKWVYQLKRGSAKKIKSNSEDDFFVFMEFNIPFIKNRDYVGRCKGEQIGKSYKIDIEAYPSLIPENKNKVRIPLNNGSWNIEYVDDHTCILEQQTLSYPGGNIPQKMVNLGIVEIPYFTMMKLRKLLKGK